MRWRLLPPAIVRFQTMPFLLRSTAQSSRSPSASPVATLRKTRSPQTIGVAPVREGVASFHATFSVGDQVRGSPVSVLMPFNDGPRHCGQCCADTAAVAAATKNAARAMGGLLRRSAR